MILQSTVAGIPCQIHAFDIRHQKPFNGPAHLCDSDLDFYGYFEFDFEVLDRRGRKADWLAKKLTRNDELQIEEEVRCEYFRD